MPPLLDQEGLGFDPEAPDQVGISRESSKMPPRRGMAPDSVTIINTGRLGKAFTRALAIPHCSHSRRERSESPVHPIPPPTLGDQERSLRDAGID
jgi:hypothetical protein